MTTFLAFTIVGIVDGCIYALTATGLVVTYITSGIFNFAHGAIGMVAAFAYWDLTVRYHWPVPLALVAVLLVLAPTLGALIDRFLMRKLHGTPTEVSLVITLGLLLFLLGVGYTRWDPGVARVLPGLFPGHQVRLFSVVVSWHQIAVVIVAGAVALGLRVYLYRTRSGIALRAVVDDPALVALNGAAPARVGQLGWAIGAVLAALAGILLAPLVTLDILTLTLLVINGYAAAMVGKLRSLPLTFAGGIALGLFESYAIGYLPGNILSQLRPTLPIIFLFLVLLVLPGARLRVGRPAARRVSRVPSLRTSLGGAGAFVVGAWVVSGRLGLTDLSTASKGTVLALIMLSLVVLTGYAGQISLCQLTFVGFGAFAAGKVGHGSPLAVLGAVVMGAIVGALVALPALRLRGLYLALSTLAFAEAMTHVFFDNNRVFGQGGALHVARVHLPGISLEGARPYFMFTAVVFALAGVGVLGLRRSSFGRRLAAMADSPAACATLGMSLTWTKLAVFATSAGLAGLAGVLYGGLQGQVGTTDFLTLSSLVLLLLAVIWGVDTVVGVFLAGLLYALFPTAQAHLPHIRNFGYLATGLGAIGLGRRPEGLIAQTNASLERVRTWWTQRVGARHDRTGVFAPTLALAGVDGPPSAVSASAPVALTAARSVPPVATAPAPRPRRTTAAPGVPAPALELLGVRAGYGRIEVIHGVDLVVPSASVVALLGPNGAGKTTLLKVASCAKTPASGCVHIAGVHVNGASPETVARLGVCTIPEGRGVFANLTVAENLRMMTYRDGLRPSDVAARAYTRFPRLAERRHQLAGTLSGGEQQMLAMARAVATEPTLLLLDEISMGLAPMIVEELYGLVGQLAREGIAILIVEQFARTAMAVADYVAVMSQGRMTRLGETADVESAISAAYLGGVG